MRRRFSAVLLSLGVLALLSSCSGGQGGAASPSVAPTPSTAPSASVPSASPTDGGEARPAGVMSAFTATDLEGNELDASLFADYDLTMVNIWATFCSPCIDEMPELGELHEEYADKGFQIVGLVADTLNQDGTLDPDQVDTAKGIVEQTGADYTHLLPSPDLFGIVAQATSVPTTFFVDKDGVQVGYAYLGSRSKADWTAIIDPLLSEVGK